LDSPFRKLLQPVREGYPWGLASIDRVLKTFCQGNVATWHRDAPRFLFLTDGQGILNDYQPQSQRRPRGIWKHASPGDFPRWPDYAATQLRLLRSVPGILVPLILGIPFCANAQRAFFGAGVGAASVPRSLAPLCGSARRLTGGSVSAQAGFNARRLRVSTGLDFTARGYSDAASCIPRAGISVDSIFGPASTAALTASGDVWFLATRQLSAGVGAGWVPGRDSWFTSGGVGAQFRKIRAEVLGRRHHVAFDEVTREFTNPGVREISRATHTEESWGWLVRLLLVTR